MREIKFKYWNPIEKIMERPTFTVQQLMEGRVFLKKEQEQFIPLQFTGFKDKNDVEIYEGDIVKFPGNIYCKVIFDSNHACYQREWIDKRAVELRGYSKEMFAQNTNITAEVIGNIYENPELIAELSKNKREEQ